MSTSTNAKGRGVNDGGRLRESALHQQEEPNKTGTTTNHERSLHSASVYEKDHKRNNSRRVNEERRVERKQKTSREILITRTQTPNYNLQHRHGVGQDCPTGRQIANHFVQAPWNPIASLLPHIPALLASRISKPPLASTSGRKSKSLLELSPIQQEALILEDLIFVLMGYEGQYLQYAKSYDPSCERDRLAGPEFTIPLGLDPALRGLVVEILRMATHYVSIEAFLEVQGQRDSGSEAGAGVFGAGCAVGDAGAYESGIYAKCAEFVYFIYALGREISNQSSFDMEDDTDKEVDDFDDILESLRVGGDLTSANILSRRLHKGGKLLRLLTTRLDTLSGDPAALTLLTSLLKDASRPYMSMLNSWLHHGIIKDPHGEFLVREQKNINRETLPQDYTDEYWDRRYTLRENAIPPQLEPFRNKILLAGKYLNVVRECGGIDTSEAIENLPQSFDDEGFVRNIENAYTHANESLLRLLLTTHALPGRLKSLKQYFMLDRSYLFISLLELGASELRKPVDKINIPKLQSLLDLVLHQPGAENDPFRDELRVEMNPTSLVESLTRVVNISGMEPEAVETLNIQSRESERAPATGFSSLQLEYFVPFLVSLVISRKTIWRYQVLFRYLLSLRYLERQLLGSWQSQNTNVTWSHKTSDKEVEFWKRRTFILRARMLSFVQQLIYFCTEEVIEPNWQLFMAKLGSDGPSGQGPIISTVDEVMREHVDFLDTCLKECMLTNGRLLRRHSKLLQICTQFTSFTGRFSRELERLDSDLVGAERPATMCQLQWEHFKTEKTRHSHEDPAYREQGSSIDKLRDLSDRFEYSFCKSLQGFIDALNHFAATETPGFLGAVCEVEYGKSGNGI
ncbi:spindle pole body component alp4 protein [Rutstroemia sp. NJR-2017a BBW]|nr:spindle pole body component alp4 protein [Rutstroemia sp. NJR-2017a BBW]